MSLGLNRPCDVGFRLLSAFLLLHSALPSAICHFVRPPIGHGILRNRESRIEAPASVSITQDQSLAPRHHLEPGPVAAEPAAATTTSIPRPRNCSTSSF